MSRRALILGASGQVGQALLSELTRRGWDCQGSYFEHGEISDKFFRLDLADLSSLNAEIFRRSPDAIFLPSGWTWVDGCEDDPGRAFLVNATAPETAARAAARLNCALVYYSTEYVFGATGGPYDELRAPAPLGVYGASKLEGERRVAAAWPGALVLRTTVVYGPEPQGKNFVYQLRKSLEAGRELRVPDDQVSSPTYNADLARASVDLVERCCSGLWNVAGPDVISRFEFSKLAARAFGLDASLIKPVSTRELGQRAGRPLAAGLAIDKLVDALGWSPRDAEAGLADMAAAVGSRTGG